MKLTQHNKKRSGEKIIAEDPWKSLSPVHAGMSYVPEVKANIGIRLSASEAEDPTGNRYFELTLDDPDEAIKIGQQLLDYGRKYKAELEAKAAGKPTPETTRVETPALKRSASIIQRHPNGDLLGEVVHRDRNDQLIRTLRFRYERGEIRTTNVGWSKEDTACAETAVRDYPKPFSTIVVAMCPRCGMAPANTDHPCVQIKLPPIGT